MEVCKMEKNELVKYQNDMNKLSFKNFNNMDMNIFMALCTQVKEQGTKEIKLSFSQIKELAHYEKKSSIEEFKTVLKRMNRKLMSVNCEVITAEEDTMFVLFPTFTIKTKEELLVIAVNEKFIWLLNEMKSYTIFELTEFVNLNSKYAKHLYRILKQWRTTGKYVFHNLDEFRELMDIPVKYSNKSMVRDCVNVAVEEIQKLNNSFKDFQCEPIYAKKRGKPLEGLEFTWTAEEVPKATAQAELELKGQEKFTDVQSFDEYLKAYKGADKPSSVALKIAKDIEKGNKKKSGTAKKNAFNSFENQNNYDFDTLEEELLANYVRKD